MGPRREACVSGGTANGAESGISGGPLFRRHAQPPRVLHEPSHGAGKKMENRNKNGTIRAEAIGRAEPEETFSVYYEQATTWFCNESGNIGLVTRVCDCVRHELGASNVIVTPRSLGKPLQTAGSLAMRKSKGIANPAGKRGPILIRRPQNLGQRQRMFCKRFVSVGQNTRDFKTLEKTT